MPTLSDMLGMGIAIQLKNAFSAPAAAVVSSSRNLTNALTKDAKSVNDGWKLMAAGGGLMFLGTTLLGALFAAGKGSLDTAAKFQVLHAQMTALTKDSNTADRLFDSAKKFTLTAPFQIDQVTTAMKTLLAMGIQSNDVMSKLAGAGNWSALMNMPGGIVHAAEIIGRINSGSLSYAMRSAKTYGITAMSIRDIDPSLITKKNTIAPGADPQRFLAAFMKAIEDKFGGGMVSYMKTLPGMLTNIKDQWILMTADIGARVLPIIQASVGGILSVLARSADLIHPFAVAVGDALGMLAKWAIAIITPIGKVVVWFMGLAADHPGIFKLIAGMIALTGVVLNLAGATLFLVGAYKLVRFLLGAELVEGLASGFMATLGPIGWAITGITLLYMAWNRNLLGIRTMLLGYWETVKLVFVGVWTLLRSLSGGVGYMSVGMADALKKAGLFDTVVMLFMLAYRVKAVITGVLEGLKEWVTIGSYVMAALVRALGPVYELAKAVVSVGLGLLGLTNKLDPSYWEGFGRVLGFVVGALILVRTAMIANTLAMAFFNVISIGVRAGLIVLQGAMLAARIATTLWTGAQWLLNIAMTANPIGVIIMAIAALITVVGLAIVYHKELGAWAKRTWLDVFGGSQLGLYGVSLFAAGWGTHWANMQRLTRSVADWFKTIWGEALDWVLNKLQTIITMMSHPGTAIRNMFMGYDMATGMPATPPKTAMSKEQTDAAAQNRLTFTQMLEQNRAALAYAAGTHTAVTNAQGQPIQVHSTIRLDGKKVGNAVTTHQHAQATGGK